MEREGVEGEGVEGEYKSDSNNMGCCYNGLQFHYQKW